MPEFLPTSATMYFLADGRRTPLGCIGYRQNGDCADISMVMVARYAPRETGRRLFVELATVLPKEVKTLVVGVHGQNTPMRRLLQKLEFEETRSGRFERGREPVDA